MAKQTTNSKKEEKINIVHEAYRNVFTAHNGKIVLDDLKKSLGYGQTIYQEKASNQDLAFHLGRQSVINQIIQLIEKK